MKRKKKNRHKELLEKMWADSDPYSAKEVTDALRIFCWRIGTSQINNEDCKNEYSEKFELIGHGIIKELCRTMENPLDCFLVLSGCFGMLSMLTVDENAS